MNETMQEEEQPLEEIPSEEEDRDSVPVSYEIVTYPADFTLEGLVNKFNKGAIEIRGFQRKFVWTIKQSSRLIESFLLGLPVPAIFLFTDPKTNKQIVVDGQQRLMSIIYFFEGLFGEEQKGQRTVFKLQGLNKKSPFYEKSYSDLENYNEPAFNKINDSVLRAFVIKQLSPPDDDSSMYNIFERLNTGGTQLVGQEIRNCIYYGEFNNLLINLNKLVTWRDIFGNKTEDKRQRDVELILRFLALFYNRNKYKKPMKDFLSDFMKDHKDHKEINLISCESLFNDTTNIIHRSLGKRPFHIRKGINAAVFDSVYVAFAINRKNIADDISKRYKELIKNDKYLKLVSSATTDEEVVRERIALAEKHLFG
jgi:hypothetical protein